MYIYKSLMVNNHSAYQLDRPVHHLSLAPPKARHKLVRCRSAITQYPFALRASFIHQNCSFYERLYSSNGKIAHSRPRITCVVNALSFFYKIKRFLDRVVTFKSQIPAEKAVRIASMLFFIIDQADSYLGNGQWDGVKDSMSAAAGCYSSVEQKTPVDLAQ